MSVVSSSNKTDRHNIEILLKEVLNTITLSPFNGMRYKLTTLVFPINYHLVTVIHSSLRIGTDIPEEPIIN
jgi:hypothetical protein